MVVSFGVTNYVGDVDGFGFGGAAGLNGAYGGLADSVVFTFTFTVPTLGDPDYGRDHFVNFVYGDYDMDPMSAIVEGATVTLLGNSDGGGLDGCIRRAQNAPGEAVTVASAFE